MSTLSLARGEQPREIIEPKHKSTLTLQREVAEKAAKETAKKSAKKESK